ncbi:MAG: hypothetical protein ACM3Q2_01070 [Syntrophothermus sp.]
MYTHSSFRLTNDTAYSVSTSLKLRIPAGWTAAEDLDCKCTDIWLIRKDFSAVLSLFAITPESYIKQHPEEDTLMSVMNYSKEMKKIKLKTFFAPAAGKDEFFNLEGNKFAAYEYQGDEELPVRVVVFRYGTSFFELAAIPASKVGLHKVQPDSLFSVQQAVLSSIK